MDPFNKEYRELTTEEASLVAEVKGTALDLYRVIDKAPAGRETSLAKTNLEQAVMWAVKAITA